MNPASKTLYEATYIGTPLQLRLDAMRVLILLPNYYAVCGNMSAALRYNNSLDWFNQMTTYMGLVKNIRTAMANETVGFLNSLVGVYLRNQVCACKARNIQQGKLPGERRES